jgi:hypothetical protein
MTELMQNEPVEKTFAIRLHGVPDGFSATVLSRTFRNPFNAIGKIEDYLRAWNARGFVMFDLLLANGTPYNRFFVGEFNGNHFVADSIVNADARHAEFARYSANQYKVLLDELDPILLSDVMREAVRNGVPL